jgi:hypothetical protein
MSSTDFRGRFKVPIYDANVIVIVAKNAVAAYNRYAARYSHPKEEEGGFSALSFTNGRNRFVMIFHSDKICVEHIGHEIKHVADFIMVWIGSKPPRPRRVGKKTREILSEPESYLTGYLHKRVYELLRKGHVKLKQ